MGRPGRWLVYAAHPSSLKNHKAWDALPPLCPAACSVGQGRSRGPWVPLFPALADAAAFVQGKGMPGPFFLPRWQMLLPLFRSRAAQASGLGIPFSACPAGQTFSGSAGGRLPAGANPISFLFCGKEKKWCLTPKKRKRSFVEMPERTLRGCVGVNYRVWCPGNI